MVRRYAKSYKTLTKLIVHSFSSFKFHFFWKKSVINLCVARLARCRSRNDITEFTWSNSLSVSGQVPMVKRSLRANWSQCLSTAAQLAVHRRLLRHRVHLATWGLALWCCRRRLPRCIRRGCPQQCSRRTSRRPSGNYPWACWSSREQYPLLRLVRRYRSQPWRNSCWWFLQTHFPMLISGNAVHLVHSLKRVARRWYKTTFYPQDVDDNDTWSFGWCPGP